MIRWRAAPGGLDGGTLRQKVTQLQQASFGSTDANVIPADQTKTASDVLRANPNSFAQVTSKLHSSEMVYNPIRPKSVERSVSCCGNERDNVAKG